MDKKIIKVSVRNLVEFIFRSGDLDNRRSGDSDKEAMQKGSKLHRKIQKQMGSTYKAEVPLVFVETYEACCIQVEGRADGIIDKEEEVIIDEIKGVYRDIFLMEKPVFVHQAQAMCYAYIYGSQKNLEQITVQMSYANLETEAVRHFSETFTVTFLKKWFYDLLNEYYKWAEFQIEWGKVRNASMQEIEFPFPYRKGQRDIVASVFRTIQHKKEIFIQAPTGIGKTMSTVYPAVRAVGEGLGEKIFYLTAKTITRTVASEAFSILRSKGLSYKVIVLTAKEKLCALDEMDCNPEHCPYAKGHFDRVNDAVFEMIRQTDDFSREALVAQAKKWRVCPFEFSLDVSNWVDAVICDYNYVFDPNVHLRRFFGDGVKGEYIFLIDEAHNLVERGRQMFSASLYKEDVLMMRAILKESFPNAKKLLRGLERLNKQLLEYKRECESFKVLSNIGNIILTCMNVLGELEEWLEETKDVKKSNEVMDFFFSIRNFLNISELVDENYVIYTQHEKNGKFRMKQFCVNPAKNIQDCLKKGVGSAFFSATLLPMQYYRSLFSTNAEDYAIYVESPFDPRNKKLIIGHDVSSKYTRRGYEEYYKIATQIKEIIKPKEGNYMVFFPSYNMLEEVGDIYQGEFVKDEEILWQTRAMNEEQREMFLDRFARVEGTLLVFCVMGGIFSEGIDLIGDKLIGAIIVGTGIPQVNQELEILKNYYDERGENGFDYAYRFPGMNKVLQAAGRVIRTADDRGVIALLDERFLARDYRRLFPGEWGEYCVCGVGDVGGVVEGFWAGERMGESCW